MNHHQTNDPSAKQWWKEPSLFWGGLLFLTLLCIITITLLVGINPTHIHVDFPLVTPLQASTPFILGTDDLGRDILSRLSVGGSISLLVGLSTGLVAVLVGGFYGLLAGYSSPKTRLWMLRALDVLYSIPGLIVVVLLSIWLGRSWVSLVLAISLFFWPDTARVVTTSVLQLKEQEYMQAYQSLGGGFWRKLVHYLLPNMLGVLLLSLLITVPRAILTESTLSFIGLGVEPPLSSWGSLASEGWQLVRVAPHILLLSGGCIVGTMLVFNLMGDGLKNHLDPLRKSSHSF